MFRQLAFLQWKTSRYAVFLLLPLCVGLPIFFAQLAARFTEGEQLGGAAVLMLHFIDTTSVAFPILAAVSGCALALTAWTWDHRTHHVYALSLPLERWRYALMKMAAGSLLLLLIVAGVLFGSVLAVTITPLPAGIHGYPIAFTTRFLFAALICYATTFAFASGTTRTTVRVFAAFFIVFILGSVVTEIAGEALGTPIRSPAALLGEALVTWPGPFNVFGGSWMLIDV
ncbi:MAG TPA: hypothetical protein VGC44_09060 [Longimicrobiales bacterium]